MTPGSRPWLVARLRRALSAPVGHDPVLMAAQRAVAREAYLDLAAMGFAEQAHGIVFSHVLRDRRERMLAWGHVGEAARLGAEWSAR